MNSVILISILLSLHGGYNNAGVSGEVAAIEAATSNDSTNVAVKTISNLTVCSNRYEDVITYYPQWKVTYTKMLPTGLMVAGQTNVVGSLDLPTIRAENPGWGNIRSSQIPDLAITNKVKTAEIPVATYSKTNEIATVTTSGHFGTSVISDKFLFGGVVLIEGAEPADTIKLIIK